MPASEDKAISDFPIALQLTNRALVFLSAPDGLGGYDTVHAELTEIGRIVLETQYTQDLGNMDVFTAIKNCRVLSGTTTPTSAQGADGQMYVKYQTVSNVDEVVGLYVKLNGEWVEISTGGSGGDVGIECTQAQYDAWEQAGTLLEDTNYYITDGQSGGGVVIDDTTASTTTVYSSDKVEDLLTPVQISASDFFTSDTISGVDTNEFYAYKIGKMVCIERCKLVNVNLVSPTYKIVGVKDEYLPHSNIRICGQFEVTGQLDNPYRMYLSPTYKGFGSEKWGTYPSIWIYSFTYFVN